MPTQSVCPYCGAQLFPHEVGNDECGSCGGRLSGADEWTPPTREGTLSRRNQPLTLPGLPSPAAFATVRQGVNLLRLSVGLGMIGGALATVCQFVAQAVQEQTIAGLARGLGLFGLLLLFVSAAAVLVSVCLCCSAPKGCEAAKWARRVIFCLIIAALCR